MYNVFYCTINLSFDGKFVTISMRCNVLYMVLYYASPPRWRCLLPERTQYWKIGCYNPLSLIAAYFVFAFTIVWHVFTSASKKSTHLSTLHFIKYFAYYDLNIQRVYTTLLLLSQYAKHIIKSCQCFSSDIKQHTVTIALWFYCSVKKYNKYWMRQLVGTGRCELEIPVWNEFCDSFDWTFKANVFKLWPIGFFLITDQIFLDVVVTKTKWRQESYPVTEPVTCETATQVSLAKPEKNEIANAKPNAINGNALKAINKTNDGPEK